MSIGKKIRFEVFKRDKFTCQYCGGAAPDVLLHVDHITPVSAGGDDAILNLVTSCADCNLGKGPRELSDDAVVVRQRTELARLQERREQLEMMMEWQQELISLDKKSVESLADIWSQLVTGYHVNDLGRQELAEWLGLYNAAELTEAMRISARQYLQVTKDGQPTRDSIDKVWAYIPKIARGRRREREKPYLADLRRIYNTIIGKEFPGTRYWEAINVMECAVLAGVSVAEIERLSRTVYSFWAFRSELESMAEADE